VRATDKGGISTSRVQRDLACRFDRLLTCRRGNGSSSFKWEGIYEHSQALGKAPAWAEDPPRRGSGSRPAAVDVVQRSAIATRRQALVRHQRLSAVMADDVEEKAHIKRLQKDCVRFHRARLSRRTRRGHDDRYTRQC